MDIDRFKGCLLGLATGDAVGTTLEFRSRGSFPELTDMVGGGPFSLKAGQWTDDTSMALCLAASLLDKQDFDPEDQINRYCNWRDHGYMSSTGECFDIGFTTSAALDRYLSTGDPYAGYTNPGSAGNGSIMRLAPVPLFYFPDEQNVRNYCRKSSATTHAAPECLDACEILGVILSRALRSDNKADVLAPVSVDASTEAIDDIASGSWKNKTIDEIAGTGYVIQSLEAALWSFLTTDSYAECVLKSANLGDDADTTAAVSGQIAGAFYGEAAMPDHWLAKLAMADEMRQMAEGLWASQP